MSRAVIINLIGHVHTSRSLHIKADIDEHAYPRGESKYPMKTLRHIRAKDRRIPRSEWKLYHPASRQKITPRCGITIVHFYFVTVTKAASQTPETAVDAVEEVVGAFVRSVYTRSSVSTHTPRDKSEILRVRDWVRVAFCELLEIRSP